MEQQFMLMKCYNNKMIHQSVYIKCRYKSNLCLCYIYCKYIAHDDLAFPSHLECTTALFSSRHIAIFVSSHANKCNWHFNISYLVRYKIPNLHSISNKRHESLNQLIESCKHCVGALLTACSGFCWLLAALLRIHWRFWSDMTKLGCSRFCVGAMVMVAGVGARPELGIGLLAKVTGWATAARASVEVAATTDTVAGPCAVVVSAGATGGGAGMGGGRAVVWVALSNCRNVDGRAT